MSLPPRGTGGGCCSGTVGAVTKPAPPAPPLVSTHPARVLLASAPSEVLIHPGSRAPAPSPPASLCQKKREAGPRRGCGVLGGPLLRAWTQSSGCSCKAPGFVPKWGGPDPCHSSSSAGWRCPDLCGAPVCSTEPSGVQPPLVAVGMGVPLPARLPGAPTAHWGQEGTKKGAGPWGASAGMPRLESCE